MPPLKEHTPTPWPEPMKGISYLDDSKSWMVPGIAHCGDGEASEANAAFIVEAVNSHERLTGENAKLRAALEKIKELTYRDDVEGPELRMQNARNYRLACEALNG